MRLKVFHTYRNDFGEAKDEVFLESFHIASPDEAIAVLQTHYKQGSVQFVPRVNSLGQQEHVYIADYKRIAVEGQCCEEITVREKKFIISDELCNTSLVG